MRSMESWIAGSLGVLAALAMASWPQTALAAPDCPGGQIRPQTLVSTGDILEFGLFDARGRFFYSDSSKNELMRIDRFGAPAKELTAINGPGAMVWGADGSLIMGYGDAAQNGTIGDADPMSGLLRVNPDTGASSLLVAGLGMANGLAQGPTGALYATNDLGFDVDRVVGTHVDHPWARVYSTNGIVVSPDDRYVYVSQTFSPAAIQRISVADPTSVTPYAVAQGADQTAGLDDMTMDRDGNLYVAANGAGQIWKVDTHGSICILASGLQMPSATTFGVGDGSRDLYVVAFGGQISRLAGVAPQPPGPRPTHHGSPAPPRRHVTRRPHRRHRRHRHRARHPRDRHQRCRDPDRDRDCDRAAAQR